MLLNIAAILLSGFSSKMLDGFVPGKSARELAYIFLNTIIIAAGTLAAVSLSPELVYALLVALPLMGKIDRLPLQAAYVAVLAISLFAVHDFSALNPLAFAALAVCAALDETELPFIRNFRPCMAVGSIAIGVLLANWLPLLAIVAFDIGYVLAAKSKPAILAFVFQKRISRQ
jgi:hypothetical protein